MKFTWLIMSLHLCCFFFPSNAVAGKQLEPSCFLELGFTHSVFSIKIVNRRAYSLDTWILDTRATDHIVCFVHLLTTITIITETIVEFPNGEAARVTHIGTITLLWNFKVLASVRTVPNYSLIRTRPNPQGLEWT